MKQTAGKHPSVIIILLFVLLLLLSRQIDAQCNNASGSTGTSIYAPFDRCGDGSTTKFTADAVIYANGTDFCYGTINAVSYDLLGQFGGSAFPVKIYMATTAATSWTSNITYNSVLSGATLVYTNNSQNWPALGWQTYTLNTPFTYTTGNLVIITESNQNAIPACGTGPVWAYNTKTNSHQYWWSTTSAGRGTSTGTRDQYRPALKGGGIFLPILLNSFAARPFEDKVELDWSTSAEVNNDHFTVERSADGAVFEAIARIKGAGNSTTTLKYTATDDTPLPGISYYRLTQTDVGGDSRYSDIVSIDRSGIPGNILGNVRPNPASEQVSFDFYARCKGALTIQLSDCAGRQLKLLNNYLEAGLSTVEIPLDDMAPGIYFLKASFDKTGYSSTHKVIKN